MSATDAVQHVAPPDSAEALLVKVEALMFQALRLDHRFNPFGKADARSAAAYHLQSGGQRVRARLALAGGLALGLPESDSLCIASCAELLHNASLVHDDIQDRDSLRRGQPALWSKFGTNVAICSGDYLLSAAYGVLCTFSQPLLLPAMLALLHERTGAAIDGQCADLTMRNDQPEGIAQYINIAKAKSGALLSLPLELVLIASGRRDALPLARKACENFAVSYQIFDDLQDVTIDCESDAVSQGQPKCLNIVFILSNQNSLAGAEKSMDPQVAARDLGLQHLALCEAIALQMPNASGVLLLDLSAQLRAMFGVLSSAECG
ncbi:MAG: polyprenyl synthetase family protein [Polaromonas sp.]|nr:polyprenyl synthetase family protein [Polaromonas sp.]